MSYTSREEKKDAFEHLTNKIEKYTFTLLMILISGVLLLKSLESQALDDNYYEAMTIDLNVEKIARTIKKQFSKDQQIIINSKCSITDINNETPKKIKNLLNECQKHINAKESALKVKDNKSINNLLTSLNFAIESTGNLVKEISVRKGIENVTLSYFRDSSKSIYEQNKIKIANESTQLFGVSLNLLLTIYVLPILHFLTLLILISFLNQLKYFIENQNYIQPHQFLFQKKIFKGKIRVGRMLLGITTVSCMIVTATIGFMFYLMVGNLTPYEIAYTAIINSLIIILSMFVLYYVDKIPGVIESATGT